MFSQHKVLLALMLCLVLVVTITPASAQKSGASKVLVIDFFGSQFGSGSFQVMYAASDIVKKHSSSIKGLIHESFGAADNLKHMDADAKLRKHAFFVTSSPAMYGARTGKPKEMFDRPIKGAKLLFLQNDATYTLLTTDPNIKRVEDFVGKKVDVGPYGNFMALTGSYLLQAYGLADKCASVEHTASQATMFSKLADGKTDVCPGSISRFPDGKMSPSGSTRQLMAKRKVYPVSQSKEMIRKTAKISGIPYVTWDIAEGAVYPGSRPYTTLGYYLMAVAHEDMPEEMVYEVMKVLVKHVDKFKTYSRRFKYMNKDTIAAMDVPVGDFHPGAVKAYRELGIKIGEECFK